MLSLATLIIAAIIIFAVSREYIFRRELRRVQKERNTSATEVIRLNIKVAVLKEEVIVLNELADRHLSVVIPILDQLNVKP